MALRWYPVQFARLPVDAANSGVVRLHLIAHNGSTQTNVTQQLRYSIRNIFPGVKGLAVYIIISIFCVVNHAFEVTV